MINPDYPPFRRMLDQMVDENHPRNPAVIERAEGPDIYILSEEYFLDLKKKAAAYDREHPMPQDPEEAAEAEILRSLLEDRQS